MAEGSIPSKRPKRGPQTARERQQRQQTGHDRVSFRERADGTRTYYVFVRALKKQGQSPYAMADGGLKAALALRAELDSRTNRGERTLLPSRRTVVEVANEWYAPGGYPAALALASGLDPRYPYRARESGPRECHETLRR